MNLVYTPYQLDQSDKQPLSFLILLSFNTIINLYYQFTRVMIIRLLRRIHNTFPHKNLYLSSDFDDPTDNNKGKKGSFFSKYKKTEHSQEETSSKARINPFKRKKEPRQEKSIQKSKVFSKQRENKGRFKEQVQDKENEDDGFVKGEEEDKRHTMFYTRKEETRQREHSFPDKVYHDKQHQKIFQDSLPEMTHLNQKQRDKQTGSKRQEKQQKQQKQGMSSTTIEDLSEEETDRATLKLYNFLTEQALQMEEALEQEGEETQLKRYEEQQKLEGERGQEQQIQELEDELIVNIDLSLQEEQALLRQVQMEEQRSEVKKEEVGIKCVQFYQMLEEDTDLIYSLLDTTNWKALNQLITKYQTVISSAEIHKYLDPMLIAYNPANYVQWTSSNAISFPHLQPNLIRIVAYSLAEQNKLQQLNILSKTLNNNAAHIRYQILDSLFVVFDYNGSFFSTKTEVTLRIETALSLLKVMRDSQWMENQIGCDHYQLIWLPKLWSIVDQRLICIPQFRLFFEELVVHHSSLVSLHQVYSSGLFMNIIQTLYFGSHITTQRIHSLFSQVFEKEDANVVFSQLRLKLRNYQIRNNKTAFPNARNLVELMKASFEKGHYSEGIFYYILCSQNQSQASFRYLIENAELLTILKTKNKYETLITDNLLNLSPEEIQPSSPLLTNNWKKARLFQQFKKGKEKTIKHNNKILQKQDKYLAAYASNKKGVIKDKQNANQIKIEDYKLRRDFYLSQDSEASSAEVDDPFVLDLEFLHRATLRKEAMQERNVYRKQLYHVLIDKENTIPAIKAAIKLGKLELAFTIWKMRVRPLIHERMQKNIDYAVKSFLKEHYNMNKELNINQTADGMTMRTIQFKQEEQGSTAEVFYESIYQKMENFDKLMHQSLPEGEFKHDFWESALILDRAKELLKMDVSGKLQHFKYEHQFANQQARQVKQFQKDKLTWRNQLIHGLGISLPEVDPQTSAKKHWVPINSLDQINQQFEDKITYVQTEGQQSSHLASQELQTLQGVPDIQQEFEEQQLTQNQSPKIEEEEEQTSSNEIFQGDNPLNIFAYSKQHNLNGYDYQAFLKVAKEQLRPQFEQEYEDQKEFIKHMFSLEAIAEESRLTDNHTLQKRLNHAEESVKNPLIKAKLMRYGLWNFDFLTVSDPKEYLEKADNFCDAFFDFKKYLGMKQPRSIPNKSRQLIKNYQDVVFYRQITAQLVEQLLLKRHQLFLQAEAVVQISPDPQVEQLITWGILNNEPMAIYLGQKLAMLTNQQISHQTALAVSQYLSHKQELPEQRIMKCKEALRIVGRIKRQHIYSFSHDYEHITVRKHFRKFIEKRQDQLDSSALNYLLMTDPTSQRQDSDLNVKNRLKRGHLTV